MNSKLELVSSMLNAVDSLIDRMKRMTFIAKRTKLELQDNPNLHLNPCAVCGSVLTRYGTCAGCESKSNGHSNA